MSGVERRYFRKKQNAQKINGQEHASQSNSACEVASTSTVLHQSSTGSRRPQFINKKKNPTDLGMGQKASQNQQTGSKTVVNQTFDFPFLQDDATKEFIKKSQVMIIMRGLPGSGKTCLTSNLENIFRVSCIVCSADHFFMENGVYRFNPSKLKGAHSYSQNKAIQACFSGKHIVIIDNTNIRLWEMEPYIKYANEMNYILIVVEPKTPWKNDIVQLSAKSKHRLSVDILKKRAQEWEDIIPLYYGWFINQADSLALIQIAQGLLDECLVVKDFNKQIQEQLSFCGQSDLDNYFNLNEDKNLHCTAMYCGETSPNAQLKKVFKKAIGSCGTIAVIGFVVTPYTLGARVKLSNEQLNLWAQDDDERAPPVQVGLGVMKNSQRHTPQAKSNVRTKKKTCIPTLQSHVLKSKKRYAPTYGRGSRAHLTLGCADGVSPVKTGFDLLEAVDFEQQSIRDGKETQTYFLDNCSIRKYGQDTWVIYPNKMFLIDAMFSHYLQNQVN